MRRWHLVSDCLFTVQLLLQRKVTDRALTLISVFNVIQEAVGGVEAFSIGVKS